MSASHHTRIRITRNQTESDPTTDNTYSDEQGPSEDSLEDEEDWSDELDPEDSASTPPRHHRPQSRGQRGAERRHKVVYRTAPASSFDYRTSDQSASLDPPYEPFGGRGHYPPPGPPYFNRPPQSAAYPQSNAPGFNQMVPYGPPHGYNNPFAPQGGGGNYFNGDPRGWEQNGMMPYGQAYYNGHYPVPHHMQQYSHHYSPPPPPPTDIGPSRTPGPEAVRDDPEKEAMKKRLAEIEAQQKKKESELKQKELEARIREEAEINFKLKMEQMKRDEAVRAEERKAADEKLKREIEEARKDADRAARAALEADRKAELERQKREAEALEKLRKEIEQAKKDAERAARDAVEKDRKAEEERKQREADAIAHAEREARDKIEKERKAEEERKKRDAEAAAVAEAAAKAKLEAAIKAKEDAEAAAKKKLEEETEWRKRLEEEAKLKAEVEARKKIADEKKAAEDEKAAADAKKKEEDAFKKKATEDAKVKYEESLRKGLGKDKAPIRFKDAVGRKFSFPYHICQSWQGMEELIKQAFLHVDGIGPHVQAGHYDLVGPNGEIILPQVWEKVIEPDWAVSMHMWPMDRPTPGGIPRGGPPGMMGRFPPGAGPRGGGPMPPPPGGHRMPFAGGAGPRPLGVRPPGPPPGVHIVETSSRQPKKSSKSKKGVLAWIGGKPAKSSKGKRT